MFCTVQTIGCVSTEPELKESQNTKTKYLRLKLIVEKGYGNNKTTLNLEATFFGDKAERLIKAKAKSGRMIAIAGDIRGISVYQGADGKFLATLVMDPYEWSFAAPPPKKEEYVNGNGSFHSKSNTTHSAPLEFENFPVMVYGLQEDLPQKTPHYSLPKTATYL